jgi:hypothetical protein
MGILLFGYTNRPCILTWINVLGPMFSARGRHRGYDGMLAGDRGRRGRHHQHAGDAAENSKVHYLNLNLRPQNAPSACHISTAGRRIARDARHQATPPL